MYIDRAKIKQKYGYYIRKLLRTTYWDKKKKKVCKKTIMSLNHLNERQLEVLDYILKNREKLSELVDIKLIESEQGISIGGLMTVYTIAERLGIKKALGSSCEGMKSLWMVIARVLERGSRLHAVRAAKWRAVPEVLGIHKMNEDNLYTGLRWLAKEQGRIEKVLYKKTKNETLFLYDVTSVYLEGQKNEYGGYGYNRDRKKGKKQIIVGMLTDSEGKPVSIDVFKGNTRDPQTFFTQIEKVSERFGCKNVTFVGDRGMIKSLQIAALKERKDIFHYITAITKNQIRSLIKEGVMQYELFEEEVAEIILNDCRYILRRNSLRAQEVQFNREQKLEAIVKKVKKSNTYLKEHSRAKVEVQVKNITGYVKKLKLDSFVKIEKRRRELAIVIDKEAQLEKEKLDGCYCIKTDISESKMTKEEIHERYRDLAFVEHAFRDMKTVELESQPIYVRNASSTRGHIFSVMLGYMIIKELHNLWKDLNITVREGLALLDSLTTIVIKSKGYKAQLVPQPNKLCKQLLEKAGVVLPNALPFIDHSGIATRKMLLRKS